MNFTITERRRERLGCLLILAILLLPVCVCLFSIIWPRLVGDDFCTFDDEVYQVFRSEANNWVEQFRASDDDMPINFSTASGDEYVVLAVAWRDESNPPVLFVPTHLMLRNIYGVKGYIYSPGGPSKPDNRYEVVAFAGDIYCYSM